VSDKILVGIPLGSGGVPASTFEHILAAVRGYDVKAHVARTELNRNWLCQYALQERYDRIVMLDTDHAHPPDIIGRLVAHQVPVVAALAFNRMPTYNPMAYRRNDGHVEVLARWDGRLERITWVGSCAICIEVAILKRLRWPWWYYPPPKKSIMPDALKDISRTLPSEDIGFCENCRKAKVPVFVDTSLITPHLTEAWVTDEVYRNYNVERILSNERAIC